MKLKLIAAVFALVLFTDYNAQNNPALDSKTESKRLMTLFNKLEGTYQFQVLDSRDKTEIPLHLMDTIEAKRKQTEVVYFPYKNNVRVMVLPYSVINKKGFVPIQRIVNISSSK
jgi:hypothetical protein